MLYDRRWDAKTREPSLAGFIAWLETKDPKARYDYMNCDGLCPVDQYFVSIGIRHQEWSSPEFRPRWEKLCHLASFRRTFGALLKDARAQITSD